MEYKIDQPFPEIDGLNINLEYGEMILSNLAGINSKMNTVCLYFYNYIITEHIWPELSEVMHNICLVEMQHLEIFAKVCCCLGIDPRLWNLQNDFLEYWSPGYNVYPKQIPVMLEHAIEQEKKSIEIYQQQLQCIDEPLIQDILNHIILDEELHIHIFEEFLSQKRNV